MAKQVQEIVLIVTCFDRKANFKKLLNVTSHHLKNNKKTTYPVLMSMCGQRKPHSLWVEVSLVQTLEKQNGKFSKKETELPHHLTISLYDIDQKNIKASSCKDSAQ